VEFSLLAPFMVVGGLSTVDAGMAIYDKMMISQVLRAGSHSAIAAESVADVRSILETTAADNFTVAAGDPAPPGELALDVTEFCACPEALGTEVACTATCADGVTPTRFYDLTASLEFNGVMLPNFTLAGEMSVMAQ
jgi:Flp pilus assembly protein TadG